MKIGDIAITPQVTFLDTKANIEVYPDPQEGMEALSTDTHEKGFYNGSAWVWGSGGTSTLYQYAGVYSTPAFTDNGDGTFTLGDGEYTTFDDDDFSMPLTKYLISESTYSCTNHTTNYVIFTGSTSTISVTTDRSLINQSNVIPILTIYREDNVLHILSWDEMGKGLANKISDRLVRTKRFEVETGGLSISEAATRRVLVSGGVVWYGAAQIVLDSFTSVSDSMTLWYHVAGVWTKAAITQYNNTQYDDGTDLVSTSGGHYCVNWVFREVMNQAHVCVILGNDNYTEAEAQSSTIPALPSGVLSQSILVGRIIVKQGENVALDVSSAFSIDFSRTPVTLFSELGDVSVVLPTARALPIYDGSFWANDNYLLDTWDNSNSAGRLWGGLITDAGSGTVNISAGQGLIKLDSAGLEDVPTAITDGQGSNTALVSWNAVSGLALAGVGYNLIYWDASATTFAVQLKENFYANFDFTTDFTVGRVYYDGSVITIRLCGMNKWNFSRRVQMFGEEYFPVVRATGMMISAVGTRNIALTAGVIWAELVNRFSVDAFDSSVGGTFSYWKRNGSGGWTETTAQTQINNTQYDDGDGTLATLTTTRYGVHWVYEVHDSSVHVVFGQGNYTSAAASAATPPSTLPGLLASYATLVGKIIILKNASTMTVQSPFTTVFSAGTVSDHNDLAGLQGGATDEYYHLTATQATLAAGIPATTAGNDFQVGGGAGAWIKKTLAEVKTILGLGTAAYTASTDYAVAAKGVTNGDSHDHVGGDGAQIAYSGLSGLPRFLYAFASYTHISPLSAANNFPFSATLPSFTTYPKQYSQAVYVGAINNGSNYWVLTLYDNGTVTVIGQVNTSALGTNTGGVLVDTTMGLSSLTQAANSYIYILATKVGSPSNLYVHCPAVEYTLA